VFFEGCSLHHLIPIDMRFSGSLFLTTVLPFSAAWNRGVHQQIGFLAESFLNTETTAIVSGLRSELNGSVGRAAAWADSFRDTPDGNYTSREH
jgi:hypothetical protein